MRSDLWQAVIAAVVMLTMIDGIESLATAMAIDCIDPYHRKSDPNRVLLAMGISNVASSMFGGLTIIPGGVKSKANIAAGGRTLWSNFANAVFLSIYLLVGSTWINMIPLGVLASVLIYTGWKMCEPLIWRHIAHIGREQVVIFSFTIIVTLLTDLLVGIIAGVVAKYILDLLLCRYAIATATSAAMKHLSIIKCMGDFFRNPVYDRDYCDGVYRIYINKPLVCFNAMQLAEEIDEIPSDARAVQVHLTESVTLIDRTAAENLKYTIQEYSQSNVPVEIVGIEKLIGLSHYDACVRIASARFQTA
jgi:MFS superfamily sulfate permease-like transporter